MYNWQLPDWPNFEYDETAFDASLMTIAKNEAIVKGMGLTSSPSDTTISETAILIEEAMTNAAIEGEYLNRQDVQSSIYNQLGINQPEAHIKDKRARGMAIGLMKARGLYMYKLDELMLYDWHHAIMEPYRSITPGRWRQGSEPMRIVSGSIGRETIHFEAPPSDQMEAMMRRLCGWYNDAIQAEDVQHTAPIISAIAHLYFESIHPFEDGNGRIGRLLSIKALCQGFGYPILFPLSQAIHNHRPQYYQELQSAQSTLIIDEWIQFFLEMIIEAQHLAIQKIQWTIKKSQFFDTHRSQLNDRQSKVLTKMIDMGPSGFEGGMSAKKYQSITKTSKATATRDLQHLEQIGALIVIGAGRSTRYELNIKMTPI